jgi:hypothetical protein
LRGVAKIRRKCAHTSNKWVQEEPTVKVWSSLEVLFHDLLKLTCHRSFPEQKSTPRRNFKEEKSNS